MFALRFESLGPALRAAVATLIVAVTFAATPDAAPAFPLEFDKFSVASRSMEPTLLQRDYIVAFPLPKPARGDLVAYRLPTDGKTVYVKRIVGLPGDRVQMKDGMLYINGEAVARERVEDFNLTGDDGKSSMGRQWRETLPDGATYRTLDLVDNGQLDNTPIAVVPEGQYFMLGDNRDNSMDSRLAGLHGMVPAENIVGRVEFIYFSIAEGESPWRFWRWPNAVRWSRIMMRVR
jgi:signal peptidase I